VAKAGSRFLGVSAAVCSDYGSSAGLGNAFEEKRRHTIARLHGAHDTVAANWPELLDHFATL
jgi:hypothetical protein